MNTEALLALVPPLEAALRDLRAQVLDAFHARPGTVGKKADGSAITALDLALEQRLAATLRDLDPTFGLVSEEAGILREGLPAWHVDPLDGTANFAFRVGVFASQVALWDGKEPLVAAIYEPLRDSLTWAVKGAGCFREGERVEVFADPPDHGLVYVDLPSTGLLQERPGLVAALRQGVYKLRSLGSVGIHLRDVATGVAAGFLGARGHASPLHDLAPGVLLVREAGGEVTDLAGGDPFRTRDSLVAGTPAFCRLARRIHADSA